MPGLSPDEGRACSWLRWLVDFSVKICFPWGFDEFLEGDPCYYYMIISFTRFIGFLALVLFAAPIFSQSLPFKTLLKTTYDKDFPLVYPEQKYLLEDAVLLDTRERDEYSVSHLPAARWVGYETFTMDAVSEVSKEDTIVVYCSIGARSQEIGKKLKAAGYRNVYNLYGGIFHWVNEENPVVTRDSIVTERVHTYNKMWGMWLTKGEKVY